jgi:hypothetical protein
MPPSSPPKFDEIWSSPQNHGKVVKQADAIMSFLEIDHLLYSPPDTQQLAIMRQNVKRFLSTIKIKDILSQSLTTYIWSSWITKQHENQRKERRGTRL